MLRWCGSVEAELAIAGLVLLVWHALRIPVEGRVGVSLDHAADVLRLERALSLDVEASVIDRVSGTDAEPALAWLYRNIHLPVLFAFLAAVRLSRPAQYSFVRTVFVLSFVPALVVIWLFPLAPPRWLPELGMGSAPTDAELGAGGALFHNETAAAASQHFGFALFVAVVSLWLFPRSRIAWAAAAYPALVFLIIVGTGNHYVFDCIVGAATFALAAVTALCLHRRVSDRGVVVQPGAGLAAAGYGLIAGGLVTLHLTALTSWTNIAGAVELAAGIAIVMTSRLEPVETLADDGLTDGAGARGT
jgi:PAP2 superfamily protein